VRTERSAAFNCRKEFYRASKKKAPKALLPEVPVLQQNTFGGIIHCKHHRRNQHLIETGSAPQRKPAVTSVCALKKKSVKFAGVEGGRRREQ
jgi:hypothetical protein